MGKPKPPPPDKSKGAQKRDRAQGRRVVKHTIAEIKEAHEGNLGISSDEAFEAVQRGKRGDS